MTIFTHWMIATYFIREGYGLHEGDFSLNHMGFRIGNILPDLSAMSKTNHYVEEAKPLILLYETKVKDMALSSWERSVALGVLCHFYADFFCKYHNNGNYQKKSILNHCIYEIRLHLVLLKLKIKAFFMSKEQHSIEKQLIETNLRVFLNVDVSLDLSEVVGPYFYHSMLAVYSKESDCLVKDILFAMLASRQLLLQYLHKVPIAKQKAGYLASKYPAF